MPCLHTGPKIFHPFDQKGQGIATLMFSFLVLLGTEKWCSKLIMSRSILSSNISLSSGDSKMI